MIEISVSDKLIAHFHELCSLLYEFIVGVNTCGNIQHTTGKLHIVRFYVNSVEEEIFRCFQTLTLIFIGRFGSHLNHFQIIVLNSLVGNARIGVVQTGTLDINFNEVGLLFHYFGKNLICLVKALLLLFRVYTRFLIYCHITAAEEEPIAEVCLIANNFKIFLIGFKTELSLLVLTINIRKILVSQSLCGIYCQSFFIILNSRFEFVIQFIEFCSIEIVKILIA